MKRSAANRHRRKKPPVFYVDENLGKIVPLALIAAGYEVRPWYEHFPGAKDVEYLPAIGATRWILLTKDQHIRRNQLEVETILNSGVRAFVLTGADLRGDEQAQLLLRRMRKLERICAQRGPFVYTITRSGVITQFSNRRLRRKARRRVRA